jgi:Bacterial Ig-like domain
MTMAVRSNQMSAAGGQPARRVGGAVVLWFFAAGIVSSAAEPGIAWVRGAERTAVEVTGLNDAALAAARDWPAERWSALLAVGVKRTGAPPMLGAWKVDGRVLRFTPQFPLTPGVVYRADFDGAGLPGSGAKLTSDFTMPDPPPGPATVVADIFPSAEEVPENLLKFYLHFSAPMSRGHIYEHIHLRDEAGRDVELPFLEIDEELWDPEMTRLTLFIDPGRIKRGVRPLEEVGPALEAGRRFTLAIDAAWLDAAGRPLAQKYERTFRVAPPDRTPITPAEWKLAAPSAGRFGALRVTFPEPMDHALALRLIRVTREDGTPVAGTTALADAERRWSFTPARVWQPGEYRLVIPATLEDLAGNNVGKAFEVELLERGARRELAETVKLPFVVR